ncbi:MAG: ABC transporter substrate-binding protein [Deltaproteobacteria bacterium]|nr:ABC transporter substrate-binding protein [Deltaproteobacteria bacterium]
MKKSVFLFIVMSLLLHSRGIIAGEGPTATLKPVLDGVMDILSDSDLKGDKHLQERRGKIMSKVKEGFDFREMSKRVLGKTWRTINDEQKEYFTTLLTKLLENVYIGKLEGYSGQTTEFEAEKIKGSRAQVTTVVENNGNLLPVHYIMRERGGNWMVYDINIEGISLIRNYQQQFKSILRKEKYEGLVKVLEEKNKSFIKTKN